MVTTVTTTTVTIAAAGSLTLIVILTLLALLIQKEIVSGLDNIRAKRLSKALNVAIVPLVLVFVTSVLFEVLAILH